MIDTGLRASEVYRFCMATGWKALKGDDAEWFLSQDPRSGKTVQRTWRRALADPPWVRDGLASSGTCRSFSGQTRA